MFFLFKGVKEEVIVSIILRYLRVIIRIYESFLKRWDFWRRIMILDFEIVNILERFFEFFFRFNNNLNLENNIKFFYLVGLIRKCFCRLLINVLRIFFNSFDLNK